MPDSHESLSFDPEGAEVIEKRDITPTLNADPRSLARRIALQVLYQIDGGTQSIDIAMRYHLVLDDVTGRVVDVDEDMAGIVAGDLSALHPDSPLAQRLHLYNVYFDANGRVRPGQKPDEVARLTRTVNYMVAEDHARRLAQGVAKHADNLDDMLQEYAPDWPIDQIAVIDRNILRMALYEIAIANDDEPVPAVINEAVELANLFGAEGAARFVNGVLGAVADQINEVRRALSSSPAVSPIAAIPPDEEEDPNDDGGYDEDEYEDDDDEDEDIDYDNYDKDEDDEFDEGDDALRG
jgi:transcription antitermination protein NusB